MTKDPHKLLLALLTICIVGMGVIFAASPAPLLSNLFDFLGAIVGGGIVAYLLRA